MAEAWAALAGVCSSRWSQEGPGPAARSLLLCSLPGAHRLQAHDPLRPSDPRADVSPLPAAAQLLPLQPSPLQWLLSVRTLVTVTPFPLH